MNKRTALRAVNPLPLARATVRRPTALPEHVQSNKTPAIIWLVVLLAVGNIVKSGQPPDPQQVVTYALLACGLVFVGALGAPDLVIWVLLVALLYWSLTNEPAITDAFRGFVSRLGQTAASAVGG